MGARFGLEGLCGKSTGVATLRTQIDAVAGSAATVLLHGATGTGKELLAHAIHRRSPRSDAPFVSVNCGAIPEALPAASVEGLVHGHAGPLLRGVRLFDIYRGAPLADREKSLALRVRFGADDRTLTEAEVEAAVTGVVAALPTIGGRLRA